MTVTELCEYKGDTWEIVLDGERRFFVNAEIVGEFHLKKGQDITAEALSQITGADTLRKAKKRALYLLGERMMCRGELFSKLKKTYGGEIAEEATEYVCGLGYINDEDYAPRLADYLVRRKRWGLRRARQEMLRRGLSRELVENTLADFSEEELDEELIALIEKKYYAKIEDLDDRRRTVAALARRGYDFGAIKRCIAAVLENMTEELEDLDSIEDQL